MSQKLEDRVAQLEQELMLIKQQLGEQKSKPNWITKTAGTFRGDLVFTEIVRLGKEIRDAEQPKRDD